MAERPKLPGFNPEGDPKKLGRRLRLTDVNELRSVVYTGELKLNLAVAEAITRRRASRRGGSTG